MSTEAAGKDKGIMSGMGGMLDWILSLPDKPKHPVAKKVARIAFDILIVGLGVTLFFGLNTQFSFNMDALRTALANPSLTTLMSMPICIAGTGVGLTWLLQDIISDKYHRFVGKIGAVVMPIFLIVAGACLMQAGFHNGLSRVTMGSYWFVSLLILPLALFAIGRGCDVLGAKKPPVFSRRAAPQVAPAERHREEMRRLAEGRRHSEEIELEELSSDD